MPDCACWPPQCRLAGPQRCPRSFSAHLQASLPSGLNATCRPSCPPAVCRPPALAALLPAPGGARPQGHGLRYRLAPQVGAATGSAVCARPSADVYLHHVCAQGAMCICAVTAWISHTGTVASLLLCLQASLPECCLPPPPPPPPRPPPRPLGPCSISWLISTAPQLHHHRRQPFLRLLCALAV